MDSKQFFLLVERMREKQKEYFRTRSSGSLKESKSLEKAIDDEINRVNNILAEKKQPNLFE